MLVPLLYVCVCVRSIILHHNFIKCWWIATKLYMGTRDITVVCLMLKSPSLWKYIVVHNSGTTHHRNVKLVPKYLESQNVLLMSDVFLMF